MAVLYGGVETGGTKCVCGLARPTGELITRAEFPTRDPDSTIGEIVAFFGEHERAVAIGIGSFGPVDIDPASRTWGHVASTPKPGWSGAALAPRIRDELGLPVIFDTDVGAAAYGEYAWGAGQGLSAVAYLTVGTGIGAGLVLDGRVWHGALAPEVGHLRIPRVPEDAFPGCCPFHGDCWEGLACGPALAVRCGRPAAEIDDDDPIWDLEAAYVAAGILAITSVIAPQRLILGGGVGGRAVLLRRVRERLRELNAGYLQSPLYGDGIEEYLVPPRLGSDAGVLGAAALARDRSAAGSGDPGQVP